MMGLATQFQAASIVTAGPAPTNAVDGTADYLALVDRIICEVRVARVETKMA